METYECVLVSQNPGKVVAERIYPCPLTQESSVAVSDDPSLQLSLHCIIGRLGRNTALQEDLMQESLVHLWKLQSNKPGQTRSWYLQSCQFHARNWLTAGRSVDSPKRAQAVQRIVLDENESETALAEYHTNGELFETVSFRDLIWTLAKHLKPRERVVLQGLAEGLSAAEIASRTGISRPTILKDRRKIAALTVKLGATQSSARPSRSSRGTKRNSRNVSLCASEAVENGDAICQAV